MNTLKITHYVDKSLLSTKQLAKRWNRSPRTLVNWRCMGKGPAYISMDYAVFYPLYCIEEFEKRNPFVLNKRKRN